MGQQQLLLLVLSTVIVGLATVAGIQAFNQNQAQASQDALTNKGVSIASEIKALQGKPVKLGGVNIDGSSDPSASTIADKLGYDSATIPVDGAGPGGECVIQDPSSGNVDVVCNSDNAPQTVTVNFDPSASDGSEVTTSFSS